MDSSSASKILTFKVIRVSQLSIEPIFQNALLTTLPRCPQAPQDWFIHNRACYLILTERRYGKASIISIKASFLLGFLSYFVTLIDLFIQQILTVYKESVIVLHPGVEQWKRQSTHIWIIFFLFQKFSQVSSHLDPFLYFLKNQYSTNSVGLKYFCPSGLTPLHPPVTDSLKSDYHL